MTKNGREVQLSQMGDEGWPYVTQDGQELWFTMTHLARANA
jgi:hypothetical protein